MLSNSFDKFALPVPNSLTVLPLIVVVVPPFEGPLAVVHSILELAVVFALLHSFIATIPVVRSSLEVSFVSVSIVETQDSVAMEHVVLEPPLICVRVRR